MGGQLDGNFLPGSLPHKFIILIVTSFICLWSINFSLSQCAHWLRRPWNWGITEADCRSSVAAGWSATALTTTDGGGGATRDAAAPPLCGGGGGDVGGSELLLRRASVRLPPPLSAPAPTRHTAM